jgi:hypothetical protein
MPLSGKGASPQAFLRAGHGELAELAEQGKLGELAEQGWQGEQGGQELRPRGGMARGSP